jgi:hypothetical protein
LLRCLVQDNLRSWDMKLCQAEFAHNHAVNRSTGFSPFQIVYSSLPRGPLDLAVVPQSKRTVKRAADFVDELTECHKIVQERLEKSNEKYKKSADLKRRNVEFKEGDLVYAVLTKDRFPVGAYNKLKARKIGPIEVLKKINENAYRLKLPNDVYTSDVFNVKHLVPYHGDEIVEEEFTNSRSNFSQPGEDDAAKTREEAVQTLIPENMNLWCGVMSRSRLSESLGRCRSKEERTRVNKPRGKISRLNRSIWGCFRPNGLHGQEHALGRFRPKDKKLRVDGSIGRFRPKALSRRKLSRHAPESAIGADVLLALSR